MKQNKTIKKALLQSMIIMALLFGVFLVVSMIAILNYDTNHEAKNSGPRISDKVHHYRPLVDKYAAENGISNYVDVLLAIMMQESGGRGNDPMQSSESYCGKVGCINDPELSIKQGVYYFSKVIEEANGDLELAIQSYNFGRGFINYVLEQSGSYTQEIAINFSQEMYQNAPDKSIYSCLREEAKQYNACYGDIYYVQSVLAYRDVLAVESET
ncbi:hypothetical protein CWR48_01225 [Oceanobacillus arenosus]|uniref:CwlT-like lysozyme domain-containing protein n=1 Tax=Oceanobacillus arenosus TaxID=1229153 RepID=A0A3D8Q1P4_9BACI|nr:lysozyme family protein [Oceanobacillus arenosus]RDW22356.1 hypothetical protein CWR48_01225 [Oceanobacillus arenosus]